MDEKDDDEKKYRYYCTYCDYKTNRIYDYKKHNESQKQMSDLIILIMNR